jgi:hypothetical protein
MVRIRSGYLFAFGAGSEEGFLSPSLLRERGAVQEIVIAAVNVLVTGILDTEWHRTRMSGQHVRYDVPASVSSLSLYRESPRSFNPSVKGLNSG